MCLARVDFPEPLPPSRHRKLPLGHRQVQVPEDEGLPIVGEGGIAEVDEDIGAH